MGTKSERALRGGCSTHICDSMEPSSQAANARSAAKPLAASAGLMRVGSGELSQVCAGGRSVDYLVTAVHILS